MENYVIIDVDCGVDDAWSILMLIRAEMEFKKFKILAITCVNGNTYVDNAVQNTLRLLETVGRTDVMVYFHKEHLLIVLFSFRSQFTEVVARAYLLQPLSPRIIMDVMVSAIWSMRNPWILHH